ncbi:RagB/SusD family nutrient uptake outer membrane protein [Aquiflexum sp. LQ15W]|uniref:RagB/SusD family nutrient uptake outer membrane protein n=1 Tax=Cognataquiflexum nitidum TaxID=2922272 RepID=UPI001F12E12A|nr:RagB/SusD family nutrient uptake outer membrane protein [Cognataquiflexum nitidum]MCH6198919.1 RagB/SusD family nutrient uptake outer membrane protein [Cognataquiflexum nitidum]
MKTIQKSIYKINVLLIIVLTWSCGGFLDEENRESLTDAVLFSEPESFDQLVASVYERMRFSETFYDLDHQGTDIFTRGDIIAGISELNDYVNLNPINGSLLTYWRNYYRVIAAANTALGRADAIAGLNENVKVRGLAEVKFFRAYSYFRLVEQFGGVPLILNEIRDSQVLFARSSEEEIYNQIIIDLDEALAGTLDSPVLFGQITKNAVRNLKAKVVLTRGYKTFRSNNDFQEAAQLAEAVIQAHPLTANFATLHSRSTQRNSEVIFSLLYGSNQVSRGVGNNRHLLFKFVYDIYPGQTRSNLLHRGLGSAPTPYYYSLFKEGDQREDVTIRRIFLAEVNSSDNSILRGDTSIFFPKEAWSQELINSKKYQVINPDQYFIPNGITQVQYPMFRKFDDPGVPYTNPGINPDGERDAVIMRSAETRLIAAEAYLNIGNLELAAQHINALRTRSGLTTQISSSEVTLDLILDESARELGGEISRWMELKRTGKLIERVLANNPHAALNAALRQFHLLRPIPQTEVDISGGILTQNPGYN